MNLTPQISPPVPPSSEARPYLVRGLLGCLCLTAAIGICALLAGSFDATGARVLGTTWLVGLFCMFSLADLTVAETRHRAVGVAGIAAGATATGIGLVLIWTAGDDWGDGVAAELRAFGIAAIAAVALAHASLLLRLDLHGADPVAAVRAATLTVLTIVATLMAAPIVDIGLAGSDGYWRLLGALAILDVLGTASLPVLARGDVRAAP
jgi:hypothetical protein